MGTLNDLIKGLWEAVKAGTIVIRDGTGAVCSTIAEIAAAIISGDYTIED